MPTLSLDEIARALGGALELGASPPSGGGGHRVAGYSIDSRSLGEGDLFFALVGPRVDGHDYLAAAFAKGAAAAVVSKGDAAGAPGALVRVADTTAALQNLGAFVRRRRPLTVVGITGSAGKTTAKELTAAVVGRRFKTMKTEGNLNNTYGLPLSLLRLADDREAAVLEMGMSTPGEIARLAEIADPDVGVILNVLPVHMEYFGSLDRIAAAKGELFAGMRRDAVAVWNADDTRVGRLARGFGGATISYGVKARAAQVKADAIAVLGLSGCRFRLRHGKAATEVTLHLPGRHNVYNALAAAAVGRSLGIDLEAIREALESVRPAAMRGVLHRLPDGVEVLDDAYNSNPAAMEKAIELLRDAEPRGRRILVAGDMLELGPLETKAHARLGEQVAKAGIDLFVAVGPRSAGAARTAGRPGTAGSSRVKHFPDSEAAAPFVAAACRPGDLILVKGSRGMKMERVVQALLKRSGASPAGGESH